MNHNANLSFVLNTHLISGPLIVNFVNYLNFGVMIAGSKSSQLKDKKKPDK